jgi:hypothetical protein
VLSLGNFSEQKWGISDERRHIRSMAAKVGRSHPHGAADLAPQRGQAAPLTPLVGIL